MTLYADGVLIGTAVASGETTLVTTDGSTKIPDGNAKITTRKTRPGQSPADVGDSQPLTVTIDTVAPDRPSAGPWFVSDSGSDRSDGATNDTTPDFLLTYDAFSGSIATGSR